MKCFICNKKLNPDSHGWDLIANIPNHNSLCAGQNCIKLLKKAGLFSEAKAIRTIEEKLTLLEKFNKATI